VGLAKAPGWLERASVLDLNGKGSRVEQQAAYQRYVEEAVREGLEESPWEQVKGQLVLGSQQMWEKIRKTVRGNKREQPPARGLAPRPSFVEVKAVVEEIRGQRWEEFQDRHGDWGRELALYLGKRVSGLKLKELGREIGGADYAAVSAAVKRFERRLGAEKKLAQLVNESSSRLFKC
jgi:hypothetical protein